jgi:lysine-ketoglutarate reductase/saccharopine dehydrogenase-like protein (TIGR00300 family)
MTMQFQMPAFHAPDFSRPELQNAPCVSFQQSPADGIAPDNYHATSVYPEYLQIEKGTWVLLEKSRMDCAVVLEPGNSLAVTELRRLNSGDMVACGRSENGEDGILIHTKAFDFPDTQAEKFAFRSHLTRETSFSIDYDDLYQLIHHEKVHGFIVWVLGPAVVFDRDARNAFVSLIENGYVHALLAGNALAAHDVEGAIFGTALGQEIYSKRPLPLGHYKHLDAINRIRAAGSIEKAIKAGLIQNGIMHAVTLNHIPYVLAGSIRDDGPLPEIFGNVYEAQNQMRELTQKATTVIAMATQLHTIAAGNMTPSYQVMADGRVRPVYFYSVDMSEFAASKLADRGSLTARAIITNVQDFVVTVERGLRDRFSCPT